MSLCWKIRALIFLFRENSDPAFVSCKDGNGSELSLPFEISALFFVYQCNYVYRECYDKLTRAPGGGLVPPALQFKLQAVWSLRWGWRQETGR